MPREIIVDDNLKAVFLANEKQTINWRFVIGSISSLYYGIMCTMKKCLMLFLIGCASLHSFAIDAANSYVRITTDCPDVLAIKPVDRDFHLLVTNVAARAHVEIEAIDPWGLVRPGSGSCDVTLAVLGSYEVEDLEPDEDGNYEPNKDGRIIMFKPTFVVEPDFPSGMKQLVMDYSSFQNSEVPMEGTEGGLTDNHTATVTYIPMGEVRTLKGHVASMSVRPEETCSELLHHPSVDPNSITVAVDEEKVKWKTSKVYWYGVSNHVSSVGCCYRARFNYVFDLVVDGVLCYTRNYNVGWPKSTPGMLARALKPDVSIAAEQFADENGGTKWKAKIGFVDFTKESRIAEGPYICQYGGQMEEEERYHCDQFDGRVDVAHGGNPDLFTAKGAVYWARQANFYGLLEASNVIVQGNDVYVIGDACDAILSIASEIKRQAIDEEFSKSWKYVRARRNWTEYQAKKKVNYSAAWRYHCTYGNGSESEPTYKKHPAYR